MSSYKLPLRIRLKVSFRGLISVLKRPSYSIIVYIGFWLTLALLVWITNWRLLIDYTFSDTHTLTDKLIFFVSGYNSLITNYSPLSASILVVFAILTGINAAMLMFVVTKSYKDALSSGTKNVVSIAAAAVGAGCAACGTSFLAPVLAGASGTLSITLTMTIGIVANIIGLILILYSLYSLGIQAATLIAKDY